MSSNGSQEKLSAEASQLCRAALQSSGARYLLVQFSER